MTSFTDNLERLADLQKLGLEPVRNFTEFTVDTFEKLARKNYAVYGDVLDYAVSQARLPIDRDAGDTAAVRPFAGLHKNLPLAHPPSPCQFPRSCRR